MSASYQSSASTGSFTGVVYLYTMAEAETISQDNEAEIQDSLESSGGQDLEPVKESETTESDDKEQSEQSSSTSVASMKEARKARLIRLRERRVRNLRMYEKYLVCGVGWGRNFDLKHNSHILVIGGGDN